MDLSINQLVVYPVKSLSGTSLMEAETTETGLALDRNWMVVDENGVFLTQRQHPRMACIGTEATDEGVTLSMPDRPRLEVPVVEDGESEGEALTVEVWEELCEAVYQGEAAAGVLSSYLGRPCRLVRMAPGLRRELKRHYSFSPEMHLCFADSAPLLLTSEASLEDLNARLETAVPMDRFRPNIVVNGGTAFQEDEWRRIRIGGAIFRVARDCIRCEITTVDQLTGEKGIEPLETLERYRSGPKGARFGRKLVQENAATIRVGDEVEVLE